MAWKLRKDKLKAESPEGETAAEPVGAVEAPSEEAAPVFDLSGDAFRTSPEEIDEAGPKFVEEGPSFEPSFDHAEEEAHREPIALGGEPIPLEPIALDPIPLEPIVGGHGVTDPTFEPDPMPEFDPIVAPSEPPLEPEAIQINPVKKAKPTKPKPEEPAVETPPEEAYPAGTHPEAEPQFEISPQRENIAPGLVTTESETGLPKVAPFILDAPAGQAAPETPRMSSIVIRIGNLSATYFLTKDVTTIGRPDSVTQNYPDIEIDLDDGVSRRHAEIRRQDDGYVLEDTGSTNGTQLNGERLAPHQAVPLFPGDRIRIGERTELQFE